MPKDSFVKIHKPTSIRFGKLKAPLQKKAMELDRSLNWLVCKLCKEHPEMKILVDELNCKK